MSISICYLSWHRHHIFRQTLESHRALGLFDCIPAHNRLVYFQEKGPADNQLAAEFELQAIGSPTNVGIAAAFIQLVQACKTDYMIFCENDWMLLEPFPVVKQTLDDCVRLTASGGDADIVRLRHIAQPGDPLLSKPYYHSLGPQIDHNTFRYKLESLSWIENPSAVYGSCGRWKEVQLAYKWYVTSTADQSWSNNAFFARTAYLRDELLAAVLPEMRNLSDLYGGMEILLQNPAKAGPATQRLLTSMRMAAGGVGLFTHADKPVESLDNLRATDAKARGFGNHLNACRDMVAKYSHLLAQDDLVMLDVGANVGFFSLAVCEQLRGVFRKLILFEPCKEYAAYAHRILYKRGNVEMHQCGLGDVATTQRLYKSPGNNIGWNTFLTLDPNQASGFERSMQPEDCEIRRLDDCGIVERVHFIKIDVEGYECKVLQGAWELICRDKPFILVEVGWGTNHPLWPDCLRTYEHLFSLGYKRVPFQAKTEDILFVPL